MSHRSLPWSPIDFAKSLSDLEQDSNHQPTTMDINRRMHVLWDITKTLQNQISEIYQVMNQLVEKCKSIGQNENNQNNFNEDSHPKPVRINSNHDEVLVVSPGTQTYCDVL